MGDELAGVLFQLLHEIPIGAEVFGQDKSEKRIVRFDAAGRTIAEVAERRAVIRLQPHGKAERSGNEP